jgi:lipopolysaccharide biosynthesis glycosyltransferase
MFNICFTSNENYAQHLAVAIASILKNARMEDDFLFWIVDDNISENSKEKIESLKYIKDFKIEYIKINADEFKNFPRRKDGLALNSYFLIKVPNLLKQANKILFLDCDIIVRKSLNELFDIDIDDYYILAAEDINNISFKKERNISDEYFYFNSGVFVLNCKKWRDDNIEHECFRYVDENGNKFVFQDQEILNGVLYKKAKKLDISWNFQYVNNYVGSFDNELYKKVKENPSIIHYITSNKPWKKDSFNCLLFEYWKYLKLTQFFDENYEILMETLKTSLNELNNSKNELSFIKNTKYSIVNAILFIIGAIKRRMGIIIK